MVPKHFQRGWAFIPMPNSSVQAYPRPTADYPKLFSRASVFLDKSAAKMLQVGLPAAPIPSVRTAMKGPLTALIFRMLKTHEPEPIPPGADDETSEAETLSAFERLCYDGC